MRYRFHRRRPQPSTYKCDGKPRPGDGFSQEGFMSRMLALQNMPPAA
jgi:hypothetical protein